MASIQDLPAGTHLLLNSSGRAWVRRHIPGRYSREQLYGPWELRDGRGTGWGANFIRPAGSKDYGYYIEGKYLEPAPSVKEALAAQDALRRKFARPGAFGHWGGTSTLAKQATGDYLLVHPSELQLQLTKLGEGHASVVWQANDGWVYALERESARDPAKEVLARVVAQRQFIHLPRIEQVGDVEWRGGFGRVVHGNLYRMPRYHKLTAASRDAWRQSKVLNDCLEAGEKAANTRHGEREEVKAQKRSASTLRCLRGAVRGGLLPKSLVDALHALYEETFNYGGAWMFEFPGRNLMVDDSGRLILLDVIFDWEGVLRQRNERARATMERNRGGWR